MDDTHPSAFNKKHLSMLERFSKRHNQTRSENSDSSSSSSPSFESTSSFFSRFNLLKTPIDSQLTQSQSLTSQPSQLKPHFDKIAASISDLEKFVAENSYFLPSYDVRSSLQTVSDLKQKLDNLSSQLIPKKKFAFKSKGGNKKTDSVIVPQPEPEPSPVSISEKTSSVTVRDSPGFRNETGRVLVEDVRGSEVREFTISDLDSCEVRIIGTLRALFVHRLKDCRVYVGPVMGSTLIEGAEGCVFVMACHQIRIHHAKRSDFYLRVRSRPIIEDSDGVRFTPYGLRYHGIEDDLRGAGLDAETGNWANVDDFKWLRAVQSPNWSVMPVNERVGIVDISNPDNGKEEI
ncbi:hypothetical protein RIF29_27281 [Crotalaria pallida]|uniref:C-CAP/cofactor C-like domain-containing protein n=1 Tax=Crotalaria pallida TaxID=3830 RepID=A0AAN9HYL6_CROPI